MLLTTMPAIAAGCQVSIDNGNQRRTAPASLALVVANVSVSCAILLLRWCGFRSRSLLSITPVESIHAAGGIDQFLLAGKKRMTGRTNFDMQIAFARRAGFKSLATGAGHGYLFIFRVNSGFHFISHLL